MEKEVEKKEEILTDADKLALFNSLVSKVSLKSKENSPLHGKDVIKKENSEKLQDK